MSQTTKRVRITGRVQGVGFRAWTEARARRLGLFGWVRNEADGSVTTVISGPADKVDRMLADLAEGPIGSEVFSVDQEEASAPVSETFEIRR